MFVCWLSEGGKCRCVYIWNFPSLSARLPIEIRHNLAFRTAGKDWAVGRRWRCDTVFVMMGGMKRDWIKVFLTGRYDDAVKTNNKMFHENWVWFGWGWVVGHSTVLPFKPHCHTRPAEESTKRTTNRPMREQKKLPTNENDIFKSLFFFRKKKEKENPKTFSYPSKNLFSSLKVETWKIFMRAAAAAASTTKMENPFFLHLHQSQGASTSHDKSWVASSLSVLAVMISVLNPEFCCVASASAFCLFLPRSISSIRCDERIEWKACKRGGKKLLGRKSWNFHFSLSLRTECSTMLLFYFYFVVVFHPFLFSGWGWDEYLNFLASLLLFVFWWAGPNGVDRDETSSLSLISSEEFN